MRSNRTKAPWRGFGNSVIDRGQAGCPENERSRSGLFEVLSRQLLNEGGGIRFEARGASMSPAIRDGEMVQVVSAATSELRKGDIVLTKSQGGFRLHRLVVVDAERDVYITRGDCGQEDDAAVSREEILGIALSKEVRVGRNLVRAKFHGVGGSVLRGAAHGQRGLEKLCSMAGLTRRNMFFRRLQRIRTGLGLLALLAFVLLPFAHAQVAVDGTSSNAAADLIGVLNSATLNLTHTTGAGANRLLIVGVSINLQNANTVGVVGVTYNGTPLNFVGAHNDAGKTFRVEQWYLLNPPSGTNVPIVVTLNIPTGVTEGVVAGATTFTDVDQTVPLGTFVSGDGAAGGNSQLDVPSVINGMLLDTLAIGGNRTATVNGPQVSQWNVSTAGGTGNPDVTGVGSARAGAPSVPISETFAGGTSNWSLGAVSINPSTADVAVTTSVSAVPLGQNSTYNIKIVNNGPSAANAVTLTDTYASAGLAVVSVTPSAGTTCITAATITCTLPTPFASGATATVAVVVSTTTAGFYPNTVAVTDSGTPPDPNTGNNTFVALAPVVSVVCSPNSLGAGGALTGTLNTYYPGTANVAAGATSIPVGTATGAAGTIVNGTLLLVIQMQDASINDSQSVLYGNGSTGAGFTAINNSGNYEFVTATGPISGGFVPITGAGPGGGLVFAYTSAIASTTKGQSTYQVVLVPQYTSASLGALTATPWNGSTGGIVALSIAGQLNLNGGTVIVDAGGFRGGAGMQLTGGVAGSTNQDYWQTPPTAYTGAAGGVAGIDASKGEGVAGTPEWVETGGTFLKTTTAGAPIGYPMGTAGVDGSMARGAPGNAGGGGTDGDTAGNTENAGGGGGGNGGTGGNGGDSWNTNFSDGGYGGTPFPATIDRIAMGGGGGAGTRNNSDGDNQASGGATGGGIIFIRAQSLTGTATMTANGAAAYIKTSNDAGGGGGAGGSIIVLSQNGGEGGLTLQANGGRGGDAWDTQPYSIGNRHGPGGGGAGGVIFVSGAPASSSVTGGTDGTTLTPGVAYGSTPGAAGISTTNATLGQVTGIQFETLCPDLTLGKSHVGNFTRGAAASYTIPVSNVSTASATVGLVNLNDTLPYGLTPTSASGTGWACTVSGQTVSCTRSDSLAASGAYPSITLNAAVSQAAPATVTNTAVVGGGGEANLLNDTATDVANVVSVADLSVTDSGAPNPVAAGSNISYTQVVTNNGPSAADNATYVAAIPANTTFASIVSPPGWNCTVPASGGTGNVVCNNVDMPGSTTATFKLNVTVNAGTANGTVIADTVSVGSSVSDPNTLNNTATAYTVVGTTALGELTVSNVGSPNPVQAGNDITYTQVVTNTGSVAATGATFTEATPAHETLVSITPPPGWSCVGFPGTPCSNPSVAAGSSGTFTVVYLVTAGTANGTPLTDTATVTATNQAFGANSATANDVVGGAAQADLALSTAASPEAVLAGNNITYTQTVMNNGPSAATVASFTEATPTNTTFQSVLAPAGWTCTSPAVGGIGNVNCTDPTLAAGATANIVIVVNVAPSIAAGTITATSTVTATTTDPNAANNSTTVAIPVADVCDLAVTDTGTPNPSRSGTNIVYTQVITNTGPSNCTTATFTENLPANTTFVSEGVVNAGGVTWTCAGNNPLSCTAPSVPPGSTGTITATYNPTGANGTQVTDTVTVGTTTKDSNASNNTATVVIGLSSGAQADLAVTNSATPNPVTAGNLITYTQTLTNNGRAASVTPTFTETIPGTVVAQTLTGPGGTWTCTLATLTCTDSGNMAANTAVTFTLVVKVNNNVASGSTISETDQASSGTTVDPNPSNNSATVTTQVGDSADLSVTNAASPVPVAAGTNITYTQVVTNSGPSAATTATLTEVTPPNTTFQSVAPPAGWTCVTPAVNAAGTITCTNPSFVPGSASFSVVLGVNAGTAAGTAINNTASVDFCSGRSELRKQQRHRDRCGRNRNAGGLWSRRIQRLRLRSRQAAT